MSFKLSDRELAVVELIDRYGNIDGAHHKMWVIDQILKILLTPDEYKKFIADREADGYDWDDGCAP